MVKVEIKLKKNNSGNNCVISMCMFQIGTGK